MCSSSSSSAPSRNCTLCEGVSEDTEAHGPGASGWNADLKHLKRLKLSYTVNWRLSTLHQGRSPITAPPSVLVSMVTMFSVAAAVPLCTAQRDMNTDIESPVAWRHVRWLEDLHCSVCVQWVCVCTRAHACVCVCVHVCAGLHVCFQKFCIISMSLLIVIEAILCCSIKLGIIYYIFLYILTSLCGWNTIKDDTSISIKYLQSGYLLHQTAVTIEWCHLLICCLRLLHNISSNIACLQWRHGGNVGNTTATSSFHSSLCVFAQSESQSMHQLFLAFELAAALTLWEWDLHLHLYTQPPQLPVRQCAGLTPLLPQICISCVKNAPASFYSLII